MRSLEELNLIQQYVMQQRPPLKRDALFSDGTPEYRIPAEPNPGDKVKIRFRTAANNVDAVKLHTPDVTYHMVRKETRGRFDYYETEIVITDEVVVYNFEIETGLFRCFYDRYGVSNDSRPQYFFKIVPGFSTPDWAKGAVMYQILVDRFYNGDQTNDVLTDEYHYIRSHSRKMDSWNQPASDFSVAEFYGGDLEGVRKKLDYLKGLGVEVIYFNPLFVSPSNHKYDIQDYDYIDPHYGKIVHDEGELLAEGVTDNREATRYIDRVTNKENLEASNKLFCEIVEEIHARGMKVILDGVLNHCGSYNKWLDKERIYEGREGYEKGAYIDVDSPYHDFFRFHIENDFPYNNSYDGWWGHDTLPKLNYEGSEKLHDYIMHIAAKWVSAPFNADGWRLDVAADLGHSPEYNHKFWKEFRKVVKEANPNAIILSEHYGSAEAWLGGDEWDTVMNYEAFMEPVTYFLTGMEKHSDEYHGELLDNETAFMGAMKHNMTHFMTSSLYCAMNQLSNHDHSRFLTRTNHKVGRVEYLGQQAAEEDVNYGVFRNAILMQMTWPGAPTLYYGDEAGVCGFTDPDCRRTYPWGRENTDLIDYYRDLIGIHKYSYTLRYGSFMFLPCRHNLVCYGRFTKEDQYIVIVNNGDRDEEVDIPVWEIEVPKHAILKMKMTCFEAGYSTMPKYYRTHGGRIKLTIKGNSGLLLKHGEGYEERYADKV
ncbi:MAG: glycoside hydrolase family 13 protein [Lachnospiraceae bacterium]|nr:glycoside hydrolase family 13 protein [Lachnospiraceae bacterium]